MMKVGDIMRQNVLTVAPDATVQELLRFLSDNEISGAPVVSERDEIKGVVSATDVIRYVAKMREIPAGDALAEQGSSPPEELAEEGASSYFWDPDRSFSLAGPGLEAFDAGIFESTTVRDIMTTAAFTVGPHQTVREVAQFLLQGRIHRALVVDTGRLVGLVTTFDLLRALAEEA